MRDFVTPLKAMKNEVDTILSKTSVSDPVLAARYLKSKNKFMMGRAMIRGEEMLPKYEWTKLIDYYINLIKKSKLIDNAF